MIQLMTEITKGIVNAVKDRMDESIALAIIFFIGHIIIAMIVNIFIASSALMFTISVLGVFIFTGLTAWDTQNAKNIYLTHGGDPRYGVQFALSLYLNFINLFQMLLMLLGNRE